MQTPQRRAEKQRQWNLDERHQASGGVGSNCNYSFGFAMRAQKWIYEDNVFQAHVIDAVGIESCQCFKCAADRHYLRDNEKKRRQE